MVDNGIDAFISDINKKTEKWANRILEVMNEEWEAGLNDMYHEFGEYQSKKIQDIFLDAVATFYSAYTPKYYHRKESLYDVLDMQKDKNGIVETDDPYYDNLYDPDKVTKDRNGNSLYTKVFCDGYHGGAESIDSTKARTWGRHPNSGVPYYRRPGLVKYPDGTKKFHKYGKWGREAVQTTSPYSLIQENLSNAEEGEIYKQFEKTVNKYGDAAMKRVEARMPSIQKEIFG